MDLLAIAVDSYWCC